MTGHIIEPGFDGCDLCGKTLAEIRDGSPCEPIDGAKPRELTPVEWFGLKHHDGDVGEIRRRASAVSGA